MKYILLLSKIVVIPSLVVGLIFLLDSCVGDCGKNVEHGEVESVTKFDVGGQSCRVFTYEGHQYISMYEGGIVHSESCKCKKD